MSWPRFLTDHFVPYPREFTWPQLVETNSESEKMSLSTEALHCLTPCPSLVDTGPRNEPQDYYVCILCLCFLGILMCYNNPWNLYFSSFKQQAEKPEHLMQFSSCTKQAPCLCLLGLVFVSTKTGSDIFLRVHCDSAEDFCTSY